MKTNIHYYLFAILISISVCSCSNNFSTPTYDMGSKTYNEPFVGILKSKPSILEKSLKYPPFSWLTSDTVSFSKGFEVTFNEECIRSKTEVTFYMTDSLEQIYKGASIFYNGKKIENGRFTLTADSLIKNINLKYVFKPQLGDYISSGNIQITAKELDKVNGQDLTQESKIIGIWQCEQEIGWPIMIWLLWLVILITLIVLIVYVLYLLWQALTFIFTRLSLTKQVNISSQLKKNTDKNKKKDKKEKTKKLNEWIRIPKEELSSELFEFVERMKKRTGDDFFYSLEYYKHRDIPNKFKILSMNNSRIILDNEDAYCTIGQNKYDGSLNQFINDVPLLKNKIYHIVDEFVEKEGIIKYYTDYLGRVELVKTNLNECYGGKNELPKATKRGSENIAKANKDKGGGKGDDGGHLIAHDYNGPDEAINIVPMPSAINKGTWLKMEQRVFATCWKKNNSICTMSIEYGKNLYKPKAITVYINGETLSFTMYP